MITAHAIVVCVCVFVFTTGVLYYCCAYSAFVRVCVCVCSRYHLFAVYNVQIFISCHVNVQIFISCRVNNNIIIIMMLWLVYGPAIAIGEGVCFSPA